MSNQGLSIFDNEPEDSGDEPTQVIARGENGKSGAEQSPAGQKSATKVAEKPAPASAPSTSAESPTRQTPAARPRPAAPSGPPEAKSPAQPSGPTPNRQPAQPAKQPSGPSVQPPQLPT